jgi:amino acid transporter
MGLMVSPEVLTVLGNAVGRVGHGIVGFVILSGLIHMLTAATFARAYTQYPGSQGELRLIGIAFGAMAALVTPLCARLTVAVCVSTAVLATAGYVFNEVFLYWFPNLGFSFCLLGGILILNLAGRPVAAAGQLLFAGLALAGLVSLSVIGFFQWGNTPPPTAGQPGFPAYFSQVGLAGILLFVGFDLAGFAGGYEKEPAKAMMAALLAAGVVFAFWGWVSAAYVPSDRLADTSIPHMRTARAILGETGRIWIGITVLSGACAAVNALFLAVSRMLTSMGTCGLLPPFMAIGKDRATVSLLLLTAFVAAMMASGMAGEPILEVYIKAGMWFWLLHYGVIHGAVFTTMLRTSQPSPTQKIPAHVFLPIAGMVAMAASLAGILLWDQQAKSLVRVLVTLFATTLIFAACWVPLSKKKGWLNPF